MFPIISLYFLSHCFCVFFLILSHRVAKNSITKLDRTRAATTHKSLCDLYQWFKQWPKSENKEKRSIPLQVLQLLYAYTVNMSTANSKFRWVTHPGIRIHEDCRSPALCYLRLEYSPYRLHKNWKKRGGVFLERIEGFLGEKDREKERPEIWSRKGTVLWNKRRWVAIQAVDWIRVDVGDWRRVGPKKEN